MVFGRISFRCCTKFSDGFFFLTSDDKLKFFFPSKLWFRCRRILTVRHTFPRKRNYQFFMRPTIAHFGFEVKMMPIDNIEEFRSVGAWKVSFCAQFAWRLTSGQSGRSKEQLAGPRAFKRSGHFLWCRIFGKAQKLSVCHKLEKCYGNLQEKIQLTTPLLR